jgi:beta-1,2-mannobiose phosphorylase / 1,2-beta-oligomannan phosphorylase
MMPKVIREFIEVPFVVNRSFTYQGRIGLLIRVAERPPQQPAKLTTVILDASELGGVRELTFDLEDPALDHSDSRGFLYRGQFYLTTLSHLRLAWSDDGRHFSVQPRPALKGEGPLESYGIEDCRVTRIGDVYYLTYTAVSDAGVGVGMISTRDWQSYTRHGMILPPHNKDVAIFPEKVREMYIALHRPSGIGLGGNFIWISRSTDLLHWGEHRCIARTRQGIWDAGRIGAGAAPIRTDQGWLEMYHGADSNNRYCLGALLLDLDDPARVIGRSDTPIMEPLAPYEQTGFFGNVVFTNGQVVHGDNLRIYYGASDEVVCAAEFSIRRILLSLHRA